MIRPVPINNEIKLDPYKTIMSKTDRKGIIEYANDYFVEISGYKEWELMGQPHNILRHPDMPKVIFKTLWDKLNQAQPTIAIVKNLAKDGSFYWVVADFISKTDEEGNIKAHYARRKAIPEEVKAKISEFYTTLLNIEKKSGMEASQVYLEAYLDDIGMDYETFIHHLFGLSQEDLHAYMTSEISDESLESKDEITIENAIKKTAKKKGLFSKLFR